jgi:hypothetical protein
VTVLLITVVVFSITGMIWLHHHPEALRRRWEPTVVVHRQPVSTVRPVRLCESCGASSAVVLLDDSTWCTSCHTAAANLGYDDDLGPVL